MKPEKQKAEKWEPETGYMRQLGLSGQHSLVSNSILSDQIFLMLIVGLSVSGLIAVSTVDISQHCFQSQMSGVGAGIQRREYYHWSHARHGDLHWGISHHSGGHHSVPPRLHCQVHQGDDQIDCGIQKIFCF